MIKVDKILFERENLQLYIILKVSIAVDTLINDIPSFHRLAMTKKNEAIKEVLQSARSIQAKFAEISVQNSMDRFGPTGKVSKKSGPPFEMDLFSRLDRSDRNEPFHLTIQTHSQFQYPAVRYLPCTKWRKILITALLWIVNSGSIGTVMYSYDRSVAASQAKCMFWPLTALKEDLFDERICKILFVTWFEDFKRGVWWSHMANIWERCA